MPNYTFMLYILCFIGALMISFFLNHLFLKFASNLGIRQQGDAIIRWSNTSKPSIGGIPFYIIFLLSGLCFAIVSRQTNLLFSTNTAGIFAVTGIGFLLGLSDDAYNTKPILKFGTQILCGLLLIYTDTYIYLSPNMYFNYFITVFWVVAIMNSINMLDNMDGITAITSVFILLNILILMATKNMFYTIDGFIITAVLGSIITFLYFNWHPSKMFMGDTGSQFLGVFLATFAIKYIWNFVPATGTISQTEQLILVLLIFILPIIDTTTVTINRLRRGQSPFVGGKDHTTHNLSYFGLSDNQIGLLFGLISMVSSVMILTIVSSIENWSYLNFFLFSSYFGLVFVVLFGITQTKRAKFKFNKNEAKRRSASNLRVEFNKARNSKTA